MNTQKCLHGDDFFRYKDIRYNFSSNIFSHADLSALQDYLHSKMSCIASYPEPSPATLEALIAEREGIYADCVMVGNGATELIYLIATMMSGKSFTVHQPTFAEYERASLSADMTVCNATTPPPALEWICNPNNPDGSVWEKSALLQRIDSMPDTLFVVDASYEDYTLQPLPSVSELLERRNVIVIHSMTKRYCIPGLRLGYAIAQPKLLLSMRNLQQPWSVNALAQHAGEYILRHDMHVLPPMNDYLAEARRLQVAINSIEGFEAMHSHTNFFLCTCQRMTAAELKERLANDHGILIRDASNFPTLTPYHFRIAAQNSEDNSLLLKVLKTL